MRRRAPWLVAALLIVGMLPSAAHAMQRETDETRAARALRILLFGGSTPLLNASGGSTDAAILGGGAQVNLPIGSGHRWSLAPGATFGRGHESNTQTSVGSTTESSVDIYTLAAFLDWMFDDDCCDDDWYCGPGIYYSDTWANDKFTGVPETKIKGIHSYGLQLTEGGGVHMNKTLVLFGGATQRIGFTSYDNKSSITEDKIHAITHAIQFEGGLKW